MNFTTEHLDDNDIKFKLKNVTINIPNLIIKYNKVTNEVTINLSAEEEPPSASNKTNVSTSSVEEELVVISGDEENIEPPATTYREEEVFIISGDEDDKRNSPEPKKQKIETTAITDNQSSNDDEDEWNVSTLICSAVNCSELDLKNTCSHLLLKYINSCSFDYNAKVTTTAISTGRTHLTQIFKKAILQKYFTSHYHITDNNNSCNVFYILWGTCSESDYLGALICHNCFYNTSKDHLVIFKMIEHITPLKAFTCHIHCDAHYHCSWCFKDTCNTRCEQFRSYAFFSVSELWTTK